MLPKCEGPNKDGPGYGGLISPNGSEGGRGMPGGNNVPCTPARSRSAEEGLLFGRSDAPIGGTLPNASEEDDLVPAGGVERLDGFPVVLIVFVEVLDAVLSMDDFVLDGIDDEDEDEVDFSLDSDFCFC